MLLHKVKQKENSYNTLFKKRKEILTNRVKYDWNPHQIDTKNQKDLIAITIALKHCYKTF